MVSTATKGKNMAHALNQLDIWFLREVYVKAGGQPSQPVNGLTIAKEMELDHGDYMDMIIRLERGGYVHAPGMMAKDVVLTTKGYAWAREDAR